MPPPAAAYRRLQGGLCCFGEPAGQHLWIRMLVGRPLTSAHPPTATSGLYADRERTRELSHPVDIVATGQALASGNRAEGHLRAILRKTKLRRRSELFRTLI